MFDGAKDGKPSYRQWPKILQHFLEYLIDTWRKNKDMIMTVGSFMKDTARDWFDARDEQMWKLRRVDNYKSFLEPLDLRFKHDKKAQIAMRKLRQVKYTSDILKYLDTLQQLNMKVVMSGIMWRELIKEGLSDFILDLLPLTQGGEPQEDEALILFIKEHCPNYQRRQGEKKLVASTSMSSSTSAGKKRKRNGGGTGATPASEHSAGPPAKQLLKVSHAGTTGGGGKTRTPHFTKDEMEIALKGIQPTLREARDKRDLCRRCDLAGHKWMFCHKEISLSSTKKSGKKARKEASEMSTAVASVSAAKTKAPVHTVGPGVTSLPLQDRILAYLSVKAGDTQQPRVSSTTSAGRVFEVNSVEEELD